VLDDGGVAVLFACAVVLAGGWEVSGWVFIILFYLLSHLYVFYSRQNVASLARRRYS
jgi:hypothetical protein